MSKISLDEITPDDLWRDGGGRLPVGDLGIEYMAFGGGGVKGIAYLGVIRALREGGVLEKIKVWMGSSIGSIAILLAASGASDNFIREKFSDLDVREIIDPPPQRKWYQPFSTAMYRLSRDLGLSQGDKLLEFIEGLIEELGFCRDITLQGFLNSTGKELIPTASSINTGKGGETLFLSPSKYPDFPLAQAIRISACMPVTFSPVKVDDPTMEGKRFMLDGALYDNCPLASFDVFDKRGKLVAANRRAMGIYLMGRGDFREMYRPIDGLEDYSRVLMESMNTKLQNKILLQEFFSSRVAEVDCKDISALDYNMKDEDKEDLIRNGEEAVKRFIKERRDDIEQRGGLPEKLFAPSCKALIGGIEVSDEAIGCAPFRS